MVLNVLRQNVYSKDFIILVSATCSSVAAGSHQGGRRRSRSRSPNGSPFEGPMKRMEALYDYDPVELSPNVDAEVCRIRT